MTALPETARSAFRPENHTSRRGDRHQLQALTPFPAKAALSPVIPAKAALSPVIPTNAALPRHPGEGRDPRLRRDAPGRG